MANAETILKAIRNFAENPSPSAPKALSLTGKWGVGKTFLWDQAIVTNKDVIQETFTAYSYVSLFGIASLDQLKEKLFTNSQSYTPIDKEPTEDIIKGFWPSRKKKKSEAFEDIKKLAQNTNAANLFSKISSHAKMLPMLKSFSSYIGSAEYFLVDNYLICIDDIERRDNSLSMREILGLIDELCTKKSCKVVLIFNQQELSNAEEYNSIREKVIDLEIEYTPSYEACIRVTHEKYDKNLEKLVDCANYLSCDNIRILKKAEWVSSILFETTQTLGYTSLPRKIEHEMLVKPLILSSVIFDKFSQHSIKDIKKLLTNYSLSESDSPSKKLAQIARELRSPYGYLDDIIINIFLNGIPCEKSFKQYLITELANENAQQIYDEIDQAWSFYHDSFEDNCQVFQDTLLEVYKQRKKELTLKNFSSILTGLKITGYDLEEIIKDFLENLPKGTACAYISRHFSTLDSPPELLKAIQDKYDCTKNATLDESLEIIHSSSGWNEEHTFAIENATTEEFLDWFKSKPENMIDKIRKILSISNWPKAHEALTQALQIMYDDNELNKIRISKMLSGYFTPQVKE